MHRYSSSMLGQYRQLVHWGPLIALAIISSVSITATTCDLMWWPPAESLSGAVNLLVFLTLVLLTLSNFFNACFLGPGFVPLGWEPKDKEECRYLQYCNLCEGYKMPRSHHCRKCDRCVMKMDHHCPWINTCVGHFNHASFTYFLFFAPCGCIHALCILIPSMWRALNRQYYIFYGDGTEPIVNLGVMSFICCMFSVGLAAGVVIAVGGLFFVQIKSILRNETGIEGWIVEKANYRDREEDEEDFIFPYNLGRIQNLKQVFTWSGAPVSDGYRWTVREGCNQFTLTIEQKIQKREKRERTAFYTAKRVYSGAMCPITMGVRLVCCPPCTDEPRIPLKIGDKVKVTRWRKHWLYGDKCLEGNTKGVRRIRGWFPRKCAVEIVGDNDVIKTDDNHAVIDGHPNKKND